MEHAYIDRDRKERDQEEYRVPVDQQKQPANDLDRFQEREKITRSAKRSEKAIGLITPGGKIYNMR